MGQAQNDPRSLRRLHDAWGLALRALFQHYTPIFVGYGGHDDTLMDLLESLQPGDIKGQLIWCYYEGGKPSERIVSVVSDHKGVLVPVPDFDLLMILLGEKIGINLLDEEINVRAQERTLQYRERIQSLDTVEHPGVAAALAATFDRSGGWWAWERKAQREKDADRRETVYRQGIEHCSMSGNLLAQYASFLDYVRGDIVGAEKFFRKAVELEPKNGAVLNNLGFFLAHSKPSPDEAEQWFRKGLEIEPKNVRIQGNLADLLSNVKKDHLQADRHFQNAITINEARMFVKYFGLLLLTGKVADAERMLEAADHTLKPEEDRLPPVLHFSWAVLKQAQEQDSQPSLEELRTLLLQKNGPAFWSFENVLTFCQQNFTLNDYTFYSELADAINSREAKIDVTPIFERRLAVPPSVRSRTLKQAKPINRETVEKSEGNGSRANV